MTLLPLYLVFLLGLFSSALAPALPRTKTSYLSSRQLSACCLYYCDPFRVAANGCAANSTCLCSPTIASLLYACASCQSIMNDAPWGDLEYALGVYSTECSNEGHPISYLTLASC